MVLLNREKSAGNKISKLLKKTKISSPTIGVLAIILVVFFAFLTITTDKFLSINNLANLARQTSIVGIIAVGMTFVIISSGMDLSVGSVLALGGIIGSMIMRDGYPIPLAILAAIAVGIVVGLVNGVIINDLKVTPFIATLGMMYIVRAIVMLISNASYISPLPKSFIRFAADTYFYIPTLTIIWILVAIIASFVVKYTRLGRNIFAIGCNTECARLSGINIRKNTYLVYMLVSALASFSGVLTAGRLATGLPMAGNGYELQVIAAVVVGGGSLAGGEGTIIGTLLGAILIATIGNGGNLLGVNPHILNIIIGSLIIISVYIDGLNKKKR
ncbi:MAG: ABC transporter permease [Spirochaetales bacterium]|nr:ABC transporter permease [Spirochaetales bacterium]